MFQHTHVKVEVGAMLVVIEPGQTYKAHNQGRNITPQTIEVRTVTVSDTDVYYRIVGDLEVKQTPIERFKEIVKA
jgi:hypothetical protein